MTLLEKFIKLHELFASQGFNLYLVGGTVRDYLINKELTDMDAVTDATPDQMKSFLGKADYTYSKMGSVKYKFMETKFDITTLRRENSYIDSRHPSHIEFIKDTKIDVVRRDFTINGLYLNSKLNVIDHVNGVEDIKNRVIKVIGDPDIRLKEDPLRIIRAIRFSLDLDFSIDEELEKSIISNIDLLKKLNPEKIKMDINKIKCKNNEKKLEIFNKYGITKFINVVD